MPGPQSETSLVEREVRVEAPPERVFPYFTDPEKMVRLIGVGATLDPRPGGVFWVDTKSDYFFEGKYVAIEPHSRIVFTWGYERELFAMPPQSTAVEVSLTPTGNETVVRLAHRALPETATDFHRAGWDHYLPRLATAAAGGDPGPDPLSRTA